MPMFTLMDRTIRPPALEQSTFTTFIYRRRVRNSLCICAFEGEIDVVMRFLCLLISSHSSIMYAPFTFWVNNPIFPSSERRLREQSESSLKCHYSCIFLHYSFSFISLASHFTFPSVPIHSYHNRNFMSGVKLSSQIFADLQPTQIFH